MKKNIFLCFVHIERLGGTTLHDIIHQNWPYRYISISPHTGLKTPAGWIMTQKQFKQILNILPLLNGIGGHTIRIYLHYNKVTNKKIFYFTFLRNPVERYLSHLSYILNGSEEKINFHNLLQDKQYYNFQTKRISGSDNLELAAHLLYNKFDFIGLTDQFNASLLMLKEKIGPDFKINYSIQNKLTPKQKIYFESLSKNEQKKVINNNENDIALYKIAKKIFNNQKKEYAKNLLQDLRFFEYTNNGYLINPIKKINMLTFKTVVRTIIEPCLLKAKR